MGGWNGLTGGNGLIREFRLWREDEEEEEVASVEEGDDEDES